MASKRTKGLKVAQEYK